MPQQTPFRQSPTFPQATYPPSNRPVALSPLAPVNPYENAVPVVTGRPQPGQVNDPRRRPSDTRPHGIMPTQQRIQMQNTAMQNMAVQNMAIQNIGLQKQHTGLQKQNTGLQKQNTGLGMQGPGMQYPGMQNPDPQGLKPNMKQTPEQGYNNGRVQAPHGPPPPPIAVHGEVLTAAHLKQRVQFIQSIMPTCSSQEILEALRKNDFHIKKAVEDLVDRKVEMAAQSARSKMLMQASQMALATSQVNPLGLSSKSFYVMQEGGTGGTDCEESPRYGPGLNPALYVSKIPGAKIASSGRKKALLIGINYFGSNKELNGCCDDVARVKHLLCSVYGFLDDPASLTMLTDKPGSDLRLFPTRHNIVTAMKWLTHGAQEGDILFFHYSGHGSQQKDQSGTEVDGFDETILPLDYKKNGHISDDLIFDTMIRQLPNGVRLICIMDCCHSGSGMDLPYYWDGNKKKWEQEVFPKFSEGDVFLFSSCQDSETAADLLIPSWGAGGAVTLAIITALSQKPFDLTIAQLIKQVEFFLSERRFTQKPQLSCTQKFDPFNTTLSMEEIHANTNKVVGYQPRKNFTRP